MERSRIRASEVVTALWPAVLLVGLGAAGFLALLDWVTEAEDLARIDQPLVTWFAENRTPGMTTVLTWVTDLFGPVIMPILVAVIALVWWRVTRSWWHPALMVGAMVLSTALSMLLKELVDRARPGADLMAIPGYETSGSFPSGHTIAAATLVLVVGYLLSHDDEDAGWRMAAWLVMSVVVIGLVGLSRLYLGYHFLTDVLAGTCVGVFVLGIVVGVERWHDLALERRDPPQRPTPLADSTDEAPEWIAGGAQETERP